MKIFKPNKPFHFNAQLHTGIVMYALGSAQKSKDNLQDTEKLLDTDAHG